MNPAAPSIAMVLPAREGFAPDRAGAIAMVVARLAAASDALVIGAPVADPYAGIRYARVPASPPLLFNLAVLRRLRATNPDFVDIHQQPRLAAIAAAMLPRARIMLFLHNDPRTMRGLRRAAARRRMLHRLHRVVCVSDHLAGCYAEGLAATRKLAVLPNPLTLAELPPRPPERRREILFAGRIVEPKGIADFIAACAEILPRLPGWSARIIGGDRFGPHSPETPYVAKMREAATRAGIVWEGYRPHHAVLEAMAEAAIVAVPSRWPEPFGLTALEAMASGAALVATTAGALPEVAGNAAILVPPGDIPALAAAIARLAVEDATRAALAEAGLARATAFDTTLIAARLAALRKTSCDAPLRDGETPL